MNQTELEQDQSIVVWATPIYHRKLKLQEQKDIKTLLEPFITDDVLDQNAFNLSKQKSSIRNPKNAELPWDQFLAYLRPYIDDFYKLLRPNRNFHTDITCPWINTYDVDNFQEVHDHAFRNLSFSCIYYYELPYQPEPAGKTFFLNRYSAEPKMTDLNYIFDFFKDHEKVTLDASTGSFVIFPAWLQHFTVPTEKPRITITANLCITPAESIEY